MLNLLASSFAPFGGGIGWGLTSSLGCYGFAHIFVTKHKDVLHPQIQKHPKLATLVLGTAGSLLMHTNVMVHYLVATVLLSHTAAKHFVEKTKNETVKKNKDAFLVGLTALGTALLNPLSYYILPIVSHAIHFAIPFEVAFLARNALIFGAATYAIDYAAKKTKQKWLGDLKEIISAGLVVAINWSTIKSIPTVILPYISKSLVAKFTLILTSNVIPAAALTGLLFAIPLYITTAGSAVSNAADKWELDLKCSSSNDNNVKEKYKKLREFLSSINNNESLLAARDSLIESSNPQVRDFCNGVNSLASDLRNIKLSEAKRSKITTINDFTTIAVLASFTAVLVPASFSLWCIGAGVACYAFSKTLYSSFVNDNSVAIKELLKQRPAGQVAQENKEAGAARPTAAASRD